MRFLLLCLLLSPTLACAQVLSVSDASTGKPVPNVYVFCELGGVLTDEKGQANIESLSNCVFISVQHPAYGSDHIRFSELQRNYFTLSLKESTMSLATVQVKFNKWEQEEKQVPINIARIPQKEVKATNPQTTADLLAASGEVFIQKSQLGGGSPMIRGFATSRVLLVVDGVRMNTAIFREGNVQNVIALDANAVESAEVVFGPGAVVYGSDAMGGVMDFHTLKPQYAHKPGEEASINYLLRTSSASFEKTAHVDFNLASQRFAALSSFTFSDYDDLQMGSFGPNAYLREVYQTRINGMDTVLNNPDPRKQVQTGFSQFNLMQKLRYRPMKDLDILYGFHYSLSSEVPRYDRLVTTDGAEGLRNAEWNYGPQLWLMHNLSANLYRSTSFFDRAKTTLAYQEFEESRIDRRFGRDIRRTRTEKVRAYSASFDFEKSVWQNATLYYGTEAVFNQLRSTGFSEDITTGISQPIASRYPDGSRWAYQALYANLQQKVSDRINVQAGIRGNLVQLRGTLSDDFYAFPFTSIDNDFNALNGSLGAVFLPGEGWQLNLNLSNGFRAPNIDDAAKIFDSGDEIVVVPNPQLEPEYLYSADLGLIRSGKNWRLEGTLYYSYLQNALIRAPFSFNGRDSIEYDGVLSQVQALQNTAAATVYGAQFSGELRFARHWKVNASYHFNEGKTSEGEPIRHVAPNFGRAQLQYEKGPFSARGVFSFNESISYAWLAPSEKEKPEFYAPDGQGNFYAPAWSTFDLRTEYRFAKAISLQLACENIFDVRYRPYSSGISAPGRNFVLALRGSF